MDRISSLINGIASLANSSQLNQYSLSIDHLDKLTTLSIYSIIGNESLNEPWHYEITFTSSNKQIDINSILNQPASLTFHAPNPIKQLVHLNSLTPLAQNRTIYGVSTQEGITDENGETDIIPMTELEQIKIEILKKE